MITMAQSIMSKTNLVDLAAYRAKRDQRKKRLVEINELVRLGIITPAEAMDYLDTPDLSDIPFFSGSEIWDDPE